MSTGRSPKACVTTLVRASLLEEAPLEQIRGADDLAMPREEAEVGDAGVEVVEEALLAVSSFVPGARCTSTFRPLLGDPPRAEHRFARQPGMQPLGHPVDEQVGHRELAEIPDGERLYSSHSRAVT